MLCQVDREPVGASELNASWETAFRTLAAGYPVAARRPRPLRIAEEAAAEWLFQHAPSPSDKVIADAIREIIEECLSFGLSSLVKAAVGFSLGYDRKAKI
jgi:hypothetical protein